MHETLHESDAAGTAAFLLFFHGSIVSVSAVRRCLFNLERNPYCLYRGKSPSPRVAGWLACAAGAEQGRAGDGRAGRRQRAVSQEGTVGAPGGASVEKGGQGGRRTFLPPLPSSGLTSPNCRQRGLRSSRPPAPTDGLRKNEHECFQEQVCAGFR